MFQATLPLASFSPDLWDGATHRCSLGTAPTRHPGSAHRWRYPRPTHPHTYPAAGEPEVEVLVAEVVVEGTDDPELIEQVYKAIRTRAGEVSTRSQLREDINAVFATGFFADVRAVPSDTPLGVRVTFEVKPNPTLKAVRTEGAKVLDPEVLQKAFADQEGRVLNFGKLQASGGRD